MEDTIAAISTSPGIGAISIVRVSGKDSFEIVSKIFKGKKSPKKIKKRAILYGWIIDDEKNIIDEVLLFVMRGPHTYTGEDTIEISTHGGYIPAKKVLETVIKAGARLAEKGEFTKRAFLNGRIDLVKAESINDIVRAKTEKSFLIAEKNLRGTLSNKIKNIKEDIINIISYIEASLDFPEEDIPDIDFENISGKLEDLKGKLLSLKESYRISKAVMEGIDVVITGKTNVGKSSLFNAILNEEKAIVTPIPGTTRDIIEGWIDLEGYPVRILDTAGIRKTEDYVEVIGVSKTIGKDRKAVAVGIHDLSKINGKVIIYKDVKEGSFVPLGYSEEMKLSEVLEKTEKGKAYKSLVKDFPVFIDSSGIFSFPPILNSERTRVTTSTKDLLIEMTGDEKESVERAYRILLADMLERGCKIFSVAIEK
jgi:tRNA modification GTPase